MTESEAAPSIVTAPVSRFLGFEFVSRSAEEAVISQAVRPEYLQVEGVVHGGILATLADTAAVHLLHPDRPEGRSMTSIEFKLNFLNPALATGGDLVATARKVKVGRTVALCEVEIRQGPKPVAVGSFTYLFFDVRSSGRP